MDLGDLTLLDDLLNLAIGEIEGSDTAKMVGAPALALSIAGALQKGFTGLMEDLIWESPTQ